MKHTLGKQTLEFLKNFIDDNNEIISCLINPRGYIKESMGGIPRHVFYNLKRGTYLNYKSNNKCYLTEKGKQEVYKIILNDKIKNKKWDKKWRILIFDIPERKRKFRDNLRITLLNIGFRQLQKSVWIFPYDVIDYLYDIVFGFKEGDWFEYIEANKISSQDKMKEWFGLK